jgi:hypothetical protein
MGEMFGTASISPSQPRFVQEIGEQPNGRFGTDVD